MRQVYLFSDLEDADLEAMLQHTRSISLRPGEWLLSQGQLAERFFLVREGRMMLLRQSPGGGEKVIALLDPGQTFGEGLIYQQAIYYPISARAVVNSRLLGFDSKHFRQLLQTSPDLCFKLLSNLHEWIQHLLHELEKLTFQTATQRLAEYLLQQSGPASEDSEFTLEIPKQVLAAQLSVTPETLSRMLAQLQSRGAIRIEGRRISLLQTELLRAAIKT